MLNYLLGIWEGNTIGMLDGLLQQAEGAGFAALAAKPIKAKRCKAANGKFAKCSTPGAKPI